LNLGKLGDINKKPDSLSMQDIKNIDIRSTNSSSFNPKNKNKIPDITFKNQ